MLDEDADVIENKDEIENFITQEELYNMAEYKGVPEFDIADREHYDT